MESESKNKWVEAMKDDLQSLYDNHTFELVKLPKGKRALKNRWVYIRGGQTKPDCRFPTGGSEPEPEPDDGSGSKSGFTIITVRLRFQKYEIGTGG